MTTKATIVLHKTTKNILGIASAVSSVTRTLTVADVVGQGVVYRTPADGAVLATVPAEHVELAPEDLDEDVLLQPLHYGKDAAGNVALAGFANASVVLSAATGATVTFTNAAAGEKRKIAIVVEYLPREERFTHELEKETSTAVIPMALQAGRTYGVVALVSDHRPFVASVTAT